MQEAKVQLDDSIIVEKELDLQRPEHYKSPRVKQAVISSTFATGLFFSAPLVSEAALGDQPLTEGMSHPDVKELQEVLKAKGHFNYHTATGYYGSITTEAVAAFQRTQGLPGNGQATRATLDLLLNQAEASAQKKGGAASATGVLRQGTTSSLVMNLQEQLKAAGYFKQEPTGYYGRVTTESVRAFQQANGLAVDGIAGPQTLNALQNRTAVTITQASSPSTETAQPQSNPTLRIGAKGQAVSTLQQRLLDLGFYTGKVDGHFGNATLQAVRSLQESERLGIDGIVGPKTWSSLSTAAASKPQKDPVPTVPPAESNKAQGSSTMKVGSQGSNVQALQSQLKVIGLFNGETTGYYGTITEQAVKAFQRQQGLTVDGIAGPKTTQLLNKLAGKQPTAPDSSPGFSVMNVVADASELLGVPYVWGGTNTSGFDCSGFITYVFAKSGLKLPRSVAGIWDTGKAVASPQVGDLVFFETYTAGPSHAGIYIGNDQFVHSGTSTGVTVASLSASYWNDRYLGAKRVF